MALIRVIYFGLVIICISISLYLTYFGFLRTFRELTLGFTAVIGLLLFAADFLIQRRRERGQSILPSFLLFLVAASFSTVSNFNFLYTNFMTRDVMASTLRDQYQIFRNDMVSTRRQLDELRLVREESALRSRIENELDQMWEQMTDPGRPGCGERCESHIQTILALVGTSITDLARPGLTANEASLRQFHETFSSLVRDAVRARSAAETYEQIATLQRQIDERLRFFGTADEAIEQGVGQARLAELSESSREIERRANAILPEEMRVEHSAIDPTLGRLGEIVYSLKNAFVERPNTGVTVMSLILASVIDFIPVIFAFIAFTPGQTPRRREPKTDVFS